jgi:transposase
LELSNDISELKALVVQLLRRISELEKENSELKARLNLNSTNSSKPPSSDGLKKKPAFPKGKNSNHGGQLGHEGKTLKIVANPDRVVVIRPEQCLCGADISAHPFRVLAKRQEFEIPEPKLEVTEFQTVEVVCTGCGKVHRSEFPQGINAPTQYGVKAKAFVCLLNNEAKLSFEKTQTIFSDIFGYTINQSTIITANASCYGNLAQTERLIQENIINSPTAHSDESGIRVNGRLHWLHVTSTAFFTYLYVHPKRGREAIESEKSILERFFGWLVHDCWSSYFALTHLKHAVCGAHLLRELESLLESGSLWADEFKQYLIETHRTPIETRKERQKEIEQQYGLLLKKGFLQEPEPVKTGKKGKLKRTKGRNLLERLQKYESAVLAFAFNEHVPFTNNQAERDVRPIKVKQKISGSFRTETGAEHHARIAGFISTVRKNNLNVFKELCCAFNGYSFLTPIDAR